MEGPTNGNLIITGSLLPSLSFAITLRAFEFAKPKLPTTSPSPSHITRHHSCCSDTITIYQLNKKIKHSPHYDSSILSRGSLE